MKLFGQLEKAQLENIAGAASPLSTGRLWLDTTSKKLSFYDGAATQGVLNDPLTTEGDLLTRSATAPTRLPIGTTGQVLTVDTAISGKVKWATPTATPLTTKGDLFTFDTANQRLAYPAANDYLLTTDTAQATGLKYIKTFQPIKITSKSASFNDYDNDSDLYLLSSSGTVTIGGAVSRKLVTYKLVSGGPWNFSWSGGPNIVGFNSGSGTNALVLATPGDFVTLLYDGGTDYHVMDWRIRSNCYYKNNNTQVITSADTVKTFDSAGAGLKIDDVLGQYNTGTYTYTAKYSGTHVINVALFLTGATSQPNNFFIRTNGAAIYARLNPVYVAANTYIVFGHTTTYIVAGEIIYFTFDASAAGSIYSGQNDSWFSITRVGP
jgi:hypothetical protein